MKIELMPVFSPLPEKIKILYNNSFPNHEKRPWQQQEILTAQHKMHLLEIKSNNVFAGFISYWQLQQCIFIEHFAIDQNLRGRGLGANVMRQMIVQFKDIVLESEPAIVGDVAKKRLAFYKRLGFDIFPFPYFQPAYETGHLPHKMELLYHFNHTDSLSFYLLRDEIYKTVYNTDPTN